MIKVLVVDDSALVRKLIGQAFSREADFEVGFARNGREALAAIKGFRPDVVTLDVHMPEMDGLSCLDRIMIETPCPVVMVSSMTTAGADATLEALRLGAVDCQSAFDWDPLSASKRDPFDRRALLVALGSSELVGVAETARARVV
ncbi:chemotaxis response regulator CheB [Bradyrhizobium sp. USDA 3240]